MFAYNPTVNDRSGEILGAYTASAANTRSEAMSNLGENIGQGLAGLGGGLGGMLKDARDKTAKLEGIAATGEALNSILPTYGEEGVALQTALQGELTKAGKNPDKLAGAMMAFMPAVENLQSRFNQQSQVNAWANYRASNPGGTAAATSEPPKLDAQYGREFYMGLRNNGRTHEQALQDMRNAGLNWAINDIERPQNQGFFGMPNPAAASTGP